MLKFYLGFLHREQGKFKMYTKVGEGLNTEKTAPACRLHRRRTPHRENSNCPPSSPWSYTTQSQPVCLCRPASHCPSTRNQGSHIGDHAVYVKYWRLYLIFRTFREIISSISGTTLGCLSPCPTSLITKHGRRAGGANLDILRALGPVICIFPLKPDKAIVAVN